MSDAVPTRPSSCSGAIRTTDRQPLTPPGATSPSTTGQLPGATEKSRSQDPPYLTTTPVHRFGVNIKVKEETKRDRRIGLQEEQALLSACSEMNGAEHKCVGSSMHDRIIGALETCCRKGEMLRIQNRYV